MKLGVVRYPITFEPIPALERQFGTHFLLAIVTFGVYGIVWDYQLHTDPEKLYPETRAALKTPSCTRCEMPPQPTTQCSADREAARVVRSPTVVQPRWRCRAVRRVQA